MNVNLVTEAPTNIDYDQYEEIDGNMVFPKLYQTGEVSIIRRKFRHPNCIESNPDYVADEKLLRRCIAWWYGLGDPLGLYGETGSGKTDMLYYLADRLNEPVYLLQVNGGLLPEMVEGKTKLKQGETFDVLGLVPEAYKNGGLVILDELDKANKPLQSWFHPILERKPLALEFSKEIIIPHDQVRISATANTLGQGGSEKYSSSNKLDDALRARIGWLEVKYPPACVLRSIMNGMFEDQLPTSLRRSMIEVAMAVQKVTKGDDADMRAVFSTRTLVKWGETMIAFGLSADLNESLYFVSRGSCEPDDWDSLKAIYQRILGRDLDDTVANVLERHQPTSKKS
jgi:cobaltochelatase CobS